MANNNIYTLSGTVVWTILFASFLELETIYPDLYFGPCYFTLGADGLLGCFSLLKQPGSFYLALQALRMGLVAVFLLILKGERNTKSPNRKYWLAYWRSWIAYFLPFFALLGNEGTIDDGQRSHSPGYFGKFTVRTTKIYVHCTLLDVKYPYG